MLELADLYIETGNLARATAQLSTLGRSWPARIPTRSGRFR